MTETKTTPLLSSRSYDILNYLTLVVLPAIGAAYFTLSQLWGLPAATEVVGTIVVLETLIGALIKTSNRSYEASGAKYDGVLHLIEDEDGNKRGSFELDDDPYLLDEKTEVRFQVQSAKLQE